MKSSIRSRLITAAATLGLLAVAGTAFGQAITGASAWKLSSSDPLAVRHTSLNPNSYQTKLYNYLGATVGSYVDSAWTSHKDGAGEVAGIVDTLAGFALTDLPDFCMSCVRSAAAPADSFNVFHLIATPIFDYLGATTSGGTTVAGFDTLKYTMQVSVDGSNWSTVDAQRTVIGVANVYADVNFNSLVMTMNNSTLTRANFAALNPKIRFLIDLGTDRAGRFQFRAVYPRLIR